MIDPLAEVVSHLQPSARFGKLVGASGAWRVTREEKDGQPFYVVILKGSCRLWLTGQDEAITLTAGDFILVPAVLGAVMTSLDPTPPDAPDSAHIVLPDGAMRLGSDRDPPEVQWLVGHFAFGSPDAALLVSLLPDFVRVQGQPRLTTLVQLVIDESRNARPAREVILARLLEVLLVEAFRSSTATAASPGLMRGLSDERLAAAIRSLHADPRRPWTVADLARAASLSRSAFFARFTRAVGAAPMEYLLAWRMALAKSQLRQGRSVASVAVEVGYGSASAFSVAFTRHVGMPPVAYARGEAGADARPLPQMAASIRSQETVTT